jgi:hypothetical protein
MPPPPPLRLAASRQVLTCTSPTGGRSLTLSTGAERLRAATRYQVGAQLPTDPHRLHPPLSAPYMASPSGRGLGPGPGFAPRPLVGAPLAPWTDAGGTSPSPRWPSWEAPRRGRPPPAGPLSTPLAAPSTVRPLESQRGRPHHPHPHPHPLEQSAGVTAPALHHQTPGRDKHCTANLRWPEVGPREQLSRVCSPLANPLSPGCALSSARCGSARLRRAGLWALCGHREAERSAAAVGLRASRARSRAGSRLPPDTPCARPLASGRARIQDQRSEGGRLPSSSTSLWGGGGTECILGCGVGAGGNAWAMGCRE